MSAVRVNEVVVNCYTSSETAEWWAHFRAHSLAERFTTITASVPGDLVDVTCDDREHAEWLRAQLIERGIPKTALKVIA